MGSVCSCKAHVAKTHARPHRELFSRDDAREYVICLPSKVKTEVKTSPLAQCFACNNTVPEISKMAKLEIWVSAQP